jgi:predicted negative regulator of RcsB-dependent stress response
MIWESESAMDKFKNILKKNVRWVVTGAVIALIMGGAFFGYRAYVQAVSL